MSFYDAIRVGASGAAEDFEIERSIRIDQGTADVNNGSNFEHTYSSAGNRKTFTISVWVKKCFTPGNIGDGDDQYSIFSTGGGGSGAANGNLLFYNNDNLYFVSQPQPSPNARFITNRKFRDPSAWYHIVVAVDTTQATQSNRVKIYINGIQETSFSTETYPSQNDDLQFNQAVRHRVGSNSLGSNLNSTYGNFNGYLADFNFIDGLQLTPESFGKTKVTTGQWIPIDTAGLTFGSNGFRLEFKDNSATTATTLGKDTSGNSNNFTPNNASVTAGKEDDSMFDTPTNNFPTLSQVDRTYTTGVKLTQGNLKWQYNYKPASKTVRATMALPSTGKIYMEWENEQGSGQPGRMSWGLVRYASQGQTYDYQAYNHVDYINISYGGSTWNGTTHLNPPGSGWPSFTFYTGERAALAIDCSNGKWWLGKVASNGSTTWYANDGGTDGDPAGGTNESATLPNFTTATEWMPFVGWHDGGAASSTTFYANINFGNHSFLGTIPTGFEKLSSKVLDEPTIKLPNKHFDLLLYTGTDTAASRTITGLNFSPDWVWQKRRNGTNWNTLHDTVRGVGKTLYSNDTSLDTTNNQYGYISAFTSDGFTWSPGSTNNSDGNHTGGTYVSWCWNAGDTDSATYTVKVVSDSGNKYRFNDFGTSAVTLDLAEGGTYTFDQSDSSMSSHPMKLSTTANGTHGGGSSYNTGVTYQLDGSSVTESAFVSGFSSASSRKLIITVAASAPTLYYYCHYHSGMGGAVNTNSTLGSSNFDGTIQATVKANTTAGFSIITYTGNGSNGSSVGHGLGVTPDAVIIKRRDSTGNWIFESPHTYNGKGMYLNFNNGSDSAGADTTSRSSTLVTFDNSSDSNRRVNHSGDNYVMYCFSNVSQYSKIGKYVGNGDNNGTFVFTDFKVKFLLIKKTNTSESWILADTKRNSQSGRESPADSYLLVDSNNAESTGIIYDMLSNGFKFKSTSQNTSGHTYLYYAIGESPFKNSRAR